MTLEEALGYVFFDKRLLRRALTSRAYALEHQQIDQPYEDQEPYCVLGQAILTMVLTEVLIRAGHTTELDIAAHCTNLQQITTLAAIAQDVGVGFVVKLSQAEKQQRIYEQPVVLANTLFAVLGAVYFDGGFRAVREVVCKLFGDRISG